MSDLISRSELLEKLEEHIEYKEFDYYQEEPLINMSFEQLEEIICSQPTVEVKSVVHGEWIEHKWAEEDGGYLISNFECSQCHTWERKKSGFCPECGADMRKKVQ